MSRFFNEKHRDLQDRFGTRKLADRLEQADVADVIGAQDREFIQSRNMFFLSTVDHTGQPTVSYKGGDVGFVKVTDEKTLMFPSYDGNGMYYSSGNLEQNPKVGLLFVDFENPNRLRVHGVASVSHDEHLTGLYPGAQFVISVRVQEVFDNCPRYVHRMKQVEKSKFVPAADSTAPRPVWKRLDYIQDALSDAEQARTDSEGGAVTLEEYLEKLKRGDV